MTVAVVVDSTADISQSTREALGIEVVPLTILFGKETFLDGVEMTTEQFYRRLVDGNIHPSTSQPSPGAFAEVYERLAQTHDSIISIHLGGKLSGTVRSAEQAKELVPNVPIRVIDSGSVSMGVGFLGMEAAKMAKAGSNLDEIATRIEAMIPNIRLWAALDTLKYLERGGRIGRTRAFLGTLLNVKPIIQIREEVLPAAQVRTHKKAIAWLAEHTAAEGPYEHLAVLYTVDERYGQEMAEQLGAIHPRDQILVSELSGVVGVHGGPGLVGIVGIKKAK